MYYIVETDDPWLLVMRERDGAYIPQDARNRDWQEFLTWNAEQAEPVDIPE